MSELVLPSGGLTRESMEESNQKTEVNKLKFTQSFYVFILPRMIL